MVSKNGEAQQCANTNRASIENASIGIVDMNIVAKSDLNFQGKAIIPVSNITGTWITSSDLANALEYSNSRAVTMIYNKYADEFSGGMTQVLEVSTSGNYRKKVRVFSLRGAHLIAMFARTPVAKDFRRWVLDILDREVAHPPIVKQFTDDELMKMANLWLWAESASKMSKIIYPALRDMESRWAGNFYDLSHETRYPLDETRKILARETAHIKFSGRHAEKREALLGAIRKELH